VAATGDGCAAKQPDSIDPAGAGPVSPGSDRTAGLDSSTEHMLDAESLCGHGRRYLL